MRPPPISGSASASDTTPPPLPGSVDGSFIAPANLDGVTALALLPDDRMLVGGTFTQVDGQTAAGVVRLLPNGALDASFHAALTPSPVAGAGIVALARSLDGRIYLGGLFRIADGNLDYDLARLLPDGAVDPAFQPHLAPARTLSLTTNKSATAQIGVLPLLGFALAEDGGVVIASDGGVEIDAAAPSLAVRTTIFERLLADGRRDTGFTPYVLRAATTSAESEAVLRYRGLVGWGDGRVLIYGTGFGSGGILQLDRDGRPGPFVSTLLGPDAASSQGSAFPDISSACVLEDGSVVVGGSFKTPAGGRDSTMARLLPPDGRPDIDFAVMGNSNIVARLPVDGGLLADYSRLNRFGTRDMRWYSAALTGTAVAAVQQSDGRVVLASVSTLPPLVRLHGIDLGEHAPVILNSPGVYGIKLGTKAYLTAWANGAGLRYQWLENQVPIVGATNDSLVSPSIPRGQPWFYYAVVVTNAYGSATGQVARVEYQDPAEALDTVAWLTSPIIAVGYFAFHTPYVFKGIYINGTHDGSDSLIKDSATDGSLSFQIVGPGSIRGWYSGKAPTAIVNASQSFTGPVHSSSGWTAFEFLLQEGTNSVVISVPGGTTLDEFSFAPGITVPVAPRVVSALTSWALDVGRPLSITAAATGTPPLTFLWEFRGADGIYRSTPAGSGLTLRIDSLTRAHAGRYRLIVTNGAGASEPADILDLTVYYPRALPAWDAVIEPSEFGSGTVAGPVFAPSGEWVAASKNGMLTVLRAADGSLVRQWATTNLLALAFTADAQRVVTFDIGGRLTWHHLTDGTTSQRTIFGENTFIEFAALDPVHDRFATAAPASREVRLGRLSDGSWLGLPVPGNPGGFQYEDLAFSPDGSYVAARTMAMSGTSAWIHVWDLSTSALRHSWSVADPGEGLIFSQDGHLLAGRQARDAVCVWNVASGERLATWRDAAFTEGFGGGFRPGGNHLTLLANGTFELRTFSVETGTTMEDLGFTTDLPLYGHSEVALSPRGDRVVYFRQQGMRLAAWRDPLGLRLEPVAPVAGAPTFLVHGHRGAAFSVATSTNLITWTPWSDFVVGSSPTRVVYPSTLAGHRVFFRAKRR